MCDNLLKATAYPKHQNFPSQSLTVGTLINDRDHYIWGVRLNDFQLFLTSCKRPLDDLSDLLCSLCVLYYLEYAKNLRINMEPCGTLEIACNKSLSIK